jgi:hypothetical protein
MELFAVENLTSFWEDMFSPTSGKRVLSIFEMGTEQKGRVGTCINIAQERCILMLLILRDTLQPHSYFSFKGHFKNNPATALV